MTIITPSDLATTEQATALTVPGADQQANHRPLAEFIALALAAAASESPNTRRAYVRAWGDFLAFLSDVWQAPRPLAAEEQEPRPDGKRTRTIWVYSGDTRIFSRIDPSLRDAFILALVDAGLSRATRNLRMNAVNVLLSVAFRDSYITPDQATRLDVKPYKRRQKSDEKPTGRRLSREEARALRVTVELRARSDRKAARDLAILDLMLFAGLRRSEISGTKENGKWKFEPLRADSLAQDGGRWWLTVTGKGQKTRRVKVHDQLYKTLTAWAKVAGLTLGEGDQPLFCNLDRWGRPSGYDLNASVIGRIVAEYGAAAGLAPATGNNRLGAHDLRRTAARNAYDNGATIYEVQKFLGHADPKTTTRYIGALEDDENTAVDKIKY